MAQGRLKTLLYKKKEKGVNNLNYCLLYTYHVNPVVHTTNGNYLTLLAWRVTNPLPPKG